MEYPSPASPVYDVIIVGAGPTGLILANLLGQLGRTALLIEANDGTVGEPRAVSIDDESLRTVQSIGLLEAIMADIVPGYGSEYRSPSGSLFLRVRPEAKPYGHARRNAFRQPAFEARLREGLGRFANVEILFNSRAGAFRVDADGVMLGLDCGREVRGRYLIGCDGARSGIRQAIGAKLDGDSLDERWLIIDLENSPVETPETIVYCDPARPCIALPGPNLTRRYEFKVLPGEDEDVLLDDASVARLIGTHDAAPSSRVIRKTIYHFHARIADNWGSDRVWIAGDAAHLSPPFAGQGMNSGVRDAVNLAWKLDQVLRGRLGAGLLRSYQLERRAHVAQMIKLALRMGSVMGPKNRLRGALTRAFFRTLGLWPAARSYFAEMKYKPPPRIDAGFLIGSMLTRRGAVGRMLPQPRIATGPFNGQLLDDLLGEGFALIGIGIDAEEVVALALGPNWDGLIDRRLALPVDWVPQFAEHAGQYLLLRPDRYVMARFAASEVAQARSALEKLYQDSWM